MMASYGPPPGGLERLFQALAAARLNSGRPVGPMPGSAKTSALPEHSDASPAAIRLAALAAHRRRRGKDGPSDPLVHAIIAATRGSEPMPMPMVPPGPYAGR